MRATAILLALIGCAAPSETPTRDGQTGPRRQSLSIAGANCLSGLTATADGTLWTVAERDRVLFAIDKDNQVRPFELTGVPAGADTEAIASLGGTRFVLGTETHEAGLATDDLLIVDLDAAASTAAVVERVALDYGLWNLTRDTNKGIEGLCAVGDVLFVGVEHVITDSGRRYAPIARLDLATNQWTAFRLALTTSNGSLSALHCRAGSGATELFAVERTFGVGRILRFELAATATAGDASPTIAHDLDAFASATELNLEGITDAGDRGIVLVVDNQYKTITGPNELVFIAPR